MNKPIEPGVEKSNVKSLAEAKQKREGKPGEDKPEEEELKRALLFLALAKKMDQRMAYLYPTLAEFPRKFHLIQEGQMQFVIEEKEDGVCELFENEDAVTNAILKYTINELADKPAYLWTPPQVKQAKDFWKMSTEPLPESPKSVRWRGEKGRCYSRLPWEFKPRPWDKAKTPAWAEVIGRMTQPEAFMCWVGSLFYPESNKQQYVWLHGEGNDSKSSITRFLSRVFGRAFVSKQTPQGDGRFWLCDLVGKSLAVFPDTNNCSFVKSGLFKSLTGGDPLPVEFKGKTPTTVTFNLSTMLISNGTPNIASNSADMRRLILVELKPRTNQDDPDFEPSLWSEGGVFLNGCIALYLEKCPRFAKIPVLSDSLDELIARNEERYQAVFDRWMIMGSPTFRTLAQDMSDFFHEHFKDPRERTAFRNWLLKLPGVKDDSTKGPKDPSTGRRPSTRWYLGVKIRPVAEIVPYGLPTDHD